MQVFWQQAANAISLGSLYALTALAVGLIFGVMRLVNFAHGSYIVVCTFLLLMPAGQGAAQLFLGHLPFWLLLPSVIIIGALLAVLSEIAVFRHLRGADPTTMMIASFALGSGVQNALMMIYGSRPIAVELWPGLMAPVTIAGVVIPMLQLVIMAATISALVALSVFLRSTRFGIAMRASAENFSMAQMLGVPANSIILAAFAISGALAGLTSLLMLPQTGLADLKMAENILLIGFVATVVGGMGSLMGAVFGAYLIGILSVALQVMLPIEAKPFRDAFVFLAIIVVLMARPAGIFSFGPAKDRI